MTDESQSREDNVWVAVRLRPLLPREQLVGEQSCIRVIPNSNQIVLGKDRSFTFDCVLGARQRQQDVYESCIRDFVAGCFNGYNATIFAYGQTGSGKTYTIGGSISQSLTEIGIVPRAIQHIYNEIRASKNRHFSVRVSYIEIYKEELIDLLDLDTPSKDLLIREDDNGNTRILGASEPECHSEEELMDYLRQGSLFRQTGTTQMNEQSSRSHSIFTIFIEQKWSDSILNPLRNNPLMSSVDDRKEMQHFMSAKLHFVDLAGSERAHRTGNVGGRFKESIHINSGLLALGNVISALGDPKRKVQHIPYRDSKITRLLKDSLGGNSRTVMLCCASPAASNFDETLNVLKYANRARNIKNKPIVNRDPQSIRFEEMQSEILALREELHRQRFSLANEPSDVGQGSGKSIGMDDSREQLKLLEGKISQMKMLIDEGRIYLEESRAKRMLSRSLDGKVAEWLELIEEIENIPADLAPNEKKSILHQTNQAQELERLLSKCKQDLKNDEEIFAEKNNELSKYKMKIDQMVEERSQILANLDKAEQSHGRMESEVVLLHMKIQDLQSQINSRQNDSEHEMSLDLSDDDLQLEQSVKRMRAKSVPVNLLGARLGQSMRKPASRNIHTSPAHFTLERVMASFRARSQLLVSRLQDSDDVLQPDFSSQESIGSALDVMNGSGTSFKRNLGSRSTYRVTKPRNSNIPNSSGGSPALEIQGLSARRSDVQHNVNETQKKLHQSEIQVRQSTQRMQDLNLNIRMKQQLIGELAKNEKNAQTINKQYKEKIERLEKEKQASVQELKQLQTAMEKLNTQKQHDKAEKEKLQNNFRKKMQDAKGRVKTLQKKQRDTQVMASMTGGNCKRIRDLEGAVEKMRVKQEQLQKQLKEELERKSKLESFLKKDELKIHELELKNEQQQKVMKVKVEDASRRARQMPRDLSCNSEKLEEQKVWLDREIERVLEERKNIEMLQKELEKREDLILKREALIAKKSDMEFKKLRSSQEISKEVVSLSSKLASVERRLEETHQEISLTPRGTQQQLSEEMRLLQVEREKLEHQRSQLAGKLDEGELLSSQEQRHVIELEEGIDALDAAMEYKNDLISNRKKLLNDSANLSEKKSILHQRLKVLTTEEARILLLSYFDKVVDLKDAERKKEQQCDKLEMRLEEHGQMVRQLEEALQRSAMDADRRLTRQQHQYEQKIQMLIKQIRSNDDARCGRDDLEKDLYYYKKTSRELRRQLQQVVDSNGVLNAEEMQELLEKISTPRSDGKLKTSQRLGGEEQNITRVSRKDVRHLGSEEIVGLQVGKDRILKDSLELSHRK